MKKRNLTVPMIATAMGALLLLNGCSLSQEVGETDDMAAAAAQSEAELYQAKLAYYQGQMQLLEVQLSEMDAKMLQLQSEYQAETQKMQEELQVLRQNIASTPEKMPQDTADPEVQPPQAEDKAPQQNTPGTTAEQTTQEAPKATHAYIYEETPDGVILTKYLGTQDHVDIPAAVDGKKVIALGDRVFSDAPVSSVCIPETVETLGWFTFYGCSSLRQVVIPASVSKIGYASFDGCHKDLVLQVSENSYAQKYAASFALRYEIS